MRFFKAMQGPRSAEDEVAVGRLTAIANRTKTGRTDAVASDSDEVGQPEQPEPEQ